MVKVKPGQQEIVYRSLKGKEGVLDLYSVSGEYDFILVVEAKDPVRLNRLIADIQESRHAIRTRFIGRLR